MYPPRPNSNKFSGVSRADLENMVDVMLGEISNLDGMVDDLTAILGYMIGLHGEVEIDRSAMMENHIHFRPFFDGDDSGTQRVILVRRSAAEERRVRQYYSSDEDDLSEDDYANPNGNNRRLI